MNRNLLVYGVLLVVASIGFAHGGGIGSGGGMMAGSGMMIVADDSSLLMTNMDVSAMMGGGSFSTADRELVNIDSDGSERWR